MISPLVQRPAEVARDGGTAVRRLRIAQITHPRVADARYDGFGGAIRAVIHDQHLYLNAALIENALDGIGDGVGGADRSP